MELKTVYFDKSGPENTAAVLRIAAGRAAELGIKNVLVASTTGDTAVRAAAALPGRRVIAVSHSYGFKEPDLMLFTEANRKQLEASGGTVLTAAHAFSGLSAAMRKQFNTYVIGDIVANTLRIFGDGMKVICEISTMAADGGLVRSDEDVIAIAGSSQGADTAAVLTPVNSHRFFSLKVKEILCKPHF